MAPDLVRSRPTVAELRNGFDVSLAGDGSVGVVYFHVPGGSTRVVMDVTGYFTP